MSRNPNHNPIHNTVATLEPTLAQERWEDQCVTEFSLWLDEQLELLEARFEHFATPHSVLVSLSR